MLRLSLLLICLFPFQTFAAPHPATTTSALTDPEKGNSFIAFGFKLTLSKSNWRPIQKESESLFAEIHFAPKSPLAPQANAQISMRMDELSRPQAIESYAKKWMRDYPQYGFEVLGTKTFAHSGGQGLVVDLFHRPQNKQTRQVILLKGKKVVILTCTNDKPEFSKLLPECNQIVKDFSWLENNSRL